MITRVLVTVLVCASIVGCRANVEIDSVRKARDSGDAAPIRDMDSSFARNGQERYGNGDLTPAPSWSSVQTTVKRLPLEGLWIPAGWMGDAESPAGPLQREVCQDDFRSKPNSEQWIYSPTDSNSPQRWCAVAYQYPPGGYNFGDKPGKDLSSQGYTHVTFWAKSATTEPARLVVKSGGHTSLDAAYPASYSSELGQIELDNTWRKVSIPIGGLNHSNVACAMAFALVAENGPCSFLIDDLAFEGP